MLTYFVREIITVHTVFLDLIQLLCLCWINNIFTCLVESKAVNQEISCIVIFPLRPIQTCCYLLGPETGAACCYQNRKKSNSLQHRSPLLIVSDLRLVSTRPLINKWLMVAMKWCHFEVTCRQIMFECYHSAPGP